MSFVLNATQIALLADRPKLRGLAVWVLAQPNNHIATTVRDRIGLAYTTNPTVRQIDAMANYLGRSSASKGEVARLINAYLADSST